MCDIRHDAGGINVRMASTVDSPNKSVLSVTTKSSVNGSLSPEPIQANKIFFISSSFLFFFYNFKFHDLTIKIFMSRLTVENVPI